MRISDWSSDVCSSDLRLRVPDAGEEIGPQNGYDNCPAAADQHRAHGADQRGEETRFGLAQFVRGGNGELRPRDDAPALVVGGERQRGVEGKSVEGRVDLGGGRIIKQKK